GQVLTRTNARNEITTYAYGGAVPPGYLASITSPAYNGVSAVTRFTYDSCNRIQKIISEPDQSVTALAYDELDRKIRVTYPDKTYEQFQYTDNVTGLMTLDVTGTRDRNGRWTYRHYDSTRKMDSRTDPLGRSIYYAWCVCGSLDNVTDSNGNVTTFNRDLQGR